MKVMLASIIFLFVGISSVLACTASYWVNAPDQAGGGPCNTSTKRLLYKSSHWTVQYPQQPGFTTVNSIGFGECDSAMQCWPIFYSPEAMNNLWRQIVDNVRRGSFSTCVFTIRDTFPPLHGLAPQAGWCGSGGGGGFGEDECDNWAQAQCESSGGWWIPINP